MPKGLRLLGTCPRDPDLPPGLRRTLEFTRIDPSGEQRPESLALQSPGPPLRDFLGLHEDPRTGQDPADHAEHLPFRVDGRPERGERHDELRGRVGIEEARPEHQENMSTAGSFGSEPDEPDTSGGVGESRDLSAGDWARHG